MVCAPVVLHARVDGVARGAGHVSTMERSSEVILFVSDDLPAFGRPMMATLTEGSSSSSSGTSSSCSLATTSSSKSPVPWPCIDDTGHGSPSPSW